MMVHELVQFNRAAEVNEAQGLKPIMHNSLQPEPTNPAHGNNTIDPIRTVRMSSKYDKSSDAVWSGNNHTNTNI
jgi:hypothetical protein